MNGKTALGNLVILGVLDGTSVLCHFSLLGGTSSILRTFWGGTSQKITLYVKMQIKSFASPPAAAVEETVKSGDAKARSFCAHRRNRAPLVVQRVVALP